MSSEDSEGKLTVLFLCTGNSCRSQMAEGFTRVLHGDVLEPYSAGVETKPLDPRAVKVMAEVGVDISGQRSKNVSEFLYPEHGEPLSFDLVVTVCGHAAETCPPFPGGTRKLHMGFDDPPRLAKDATSVEEVLEHYRRVRDEIRAYVDQLPAKLGLK